MKEGRDERRKGCQVRVFGSTLLNKDELNTLIITKSITSTDSDYSKE